MVKKLCPVIEIDSIRKLKSFIESRISNYSISLLTKEEDGEFRRLVDLKLNEFLKNGAIDTIPYYEIDYANKTVDFFYEKNDNRIGFM